MPRDWLPGFLRVHWTGRDLAFALACGWHACVCANQTMCGCGTALLCSICVPGCSLGEGSKGFNRGGKVLKVGNP